MEEKKCVFCQSGKHFVLVEGNYSTLGVNCDSENRIFMYGSGDDETDYYYPRYCPNCGRRINEDMELNYYRENDVTILCWN